MVNMGREKKYNCEMCEYAGFSPSCVKNHIKAVHLKEKSFKCNHCEFATAKSGNLNIHVSGVHGDKKFKC